MAACSFLSYCSRLSYNLRYRSSGVIPFFFAVRFQFVFANVYPLSLTHNNTEQGAVTIEYVYGGNKTSFQVDVISNEWEKISAFAQDNLGRGATIIHAKGGFKNEDRVILRIVFPKYQYRKLKDYISSVDKKAFVTFTQTNAVYGEGFKKHNIKK